MNRIAHILMPVIPMKSIFTLAVACFATAVFAGEPAKKVVVPPEDDRWRLLLAAPGWLAGVEGDVGIRGLVSNIDVDPGAIVRRIDMAMSLRAEASKGRFGIMADFLYLSLSDGIGTDTVVKKLDLQVDQVLAEFAVRWRLIEGPRSWLDLYGGVRYTNLYQKIVTQPNDEQIERLVERFADEFSGRVRARIEGVLSDGRLRNALATAVRERLFDDAGNFVGPNPPEQTLPIGPVGGPSFGRLGRFIENRVQQRARELIRAAAEEARAAARAELAALRATTFAARDEARRRAAELRARVSQRIARARASVVNELKNRLHDGLDRRAARTDDWWDPFIGLRARYQFNDTFYVVAKGDVGGFGVGADFTWQAEAALGVQLTRRIFAELGYRALGVDYEDDGLTYDTVTHGVQLTLGVLF